MSHLLDLPSWRLGTGDLLQQFGLLAHLHGENSEFYKLITGVRVGYEMYNRVSGAGTVEAYEAQCIMGITEYIKKHPKASEAELAKEIQKHIEVFKAQVEAMG